MHKLNFNIVRENIKEQAADYPEKTLQEMKALQVAVYVMCGGGMLGHSAANQPEGFYIDDRVGKLNYKRNEILQAVQVLQVFREALGLKEMPQMAHFHNCGIF
jgi:hypothetical protein